MILEAIASSFFSGLGVNPNIILTKIQQLSWWARYLRDLAHQDNCCENHQFNSGIYSKAVRIITRES
jgi:hypothetical protein